MNTPKSKEITDRLGLALKSTDAARRDLLGRSIDEGRQEARAFRRVRDQLVKALGQDDPRVKALDRRVQGNERMAEFIEAGLKGSSTGGQTPKLGTSQSPGKAARGVKKGKAKGNKEEPG